VALAAAVLVEAMATRVARADEAAPAQYAIVLPTAVESEPGAVDTVSLTIAARPGYTISHDGPLVVNLAVAPETGFGLPKRQYTREDAADARADNPRFDLRYSPSQAGEYHLTVRVRFWVCTRRTCRPVREIRDVSIRVAAKAPPPDAGVDADGGGG